MSTVLSILHVVGAVFVVGPMAVLPMIGLRALRTGHHAAVAAIARSTALFSFISIAVAVVGFGVLGMADPKYDLSVTTPWVLGSTVLYALALVVNLALVVPALRGAVDETTEPMRAKIAAASGVVSVLLLGVVVLMVWKP